ncbi:RNA-binding cell elongation regulator Jag/EloR [Syntrophobacter fumaroxidans]|uniref:RNA-binding protein KhpB n=1 Tax=Syntrophobacter fumaroxidans (strain DSM 10017 / MPOB) TaxID=335543 RepID=A0LLH4_SYNFM|nr:RNA-binding cell elongation regulator Jag/EloR [Syntrophobacter fumaroxidans]ABK18276.1 single-stranded nucleic acid binding R3H domain protein [Syntrophobacter fumaroxidans MPOB]HOI96428.1 RNA-binding cell elongation regulator Jag/EloR [Syntrophobacter fumaroxidans]
MSVLEFEEKSVEEAIAAACEKLRLPREKLDIEILSKGSSGIFGIVGTRKARIRVTTKVPAVEAAAERAKEILSNILRHVDLPTVIEWESRDDHFYLNIISNGSGLLIGKRGKTLNALQYLVSKILQKEIGENYSVIVDTENYRTKREGSLTELAQQLSEKVKKSHRPLTTGPMNAQDRRIIHLALKEDQEVRTKSKGEGTLRRVVIYPVKKGRKPSRTIADDTGQQ